VLTIVSWRSRTWPLPVPLRRRRQLPVERGMFISRADAASPARRV
jgi:hypothetical protein